MPKTYEPVATTTLASDQATVTFTSISGSFTDLILVASIRTVVTNAAIYCQFNGDTGTNYSNTQLLGNGSIATSGRQTNVSQLRIGNFTASGTNNFSPVIAHFQNYSNTVTNKTVISRAGSADGGLVAEACLWRNTAAITSILVGEESGGNMRTGSILTLYGIKAA
jgi:hypothetical protein